MKIVGLLGPAGSGKTTVANYLVEKYGAKRYAFGDPLKELAKRTLDFSDDQLYGSQSTKEAVDPRYGFSPRWFLQRLGTEGVRTVFGDDFWVQLCLERIYKDRPPLAVIDDVRFVNEASVLLSENGKSDIQTFVWKLEKEHTGDHPSESEWRDAPFSHLVAPRERNLIALFDTIDDVAVECGLERIRMVMP